MKAALQRLWTTDFGTAGSRYFVFIRNAFIVLSGSVGSALLGFATQLLCARALAIGDYGRLMALLATVNIVGVFSGYGLGWCWWQSFGREGAGAFRWVPATTRLLAITSFIGACGLGGFVFATGNGFVSSAGLALLLIAILLGQSLSETTAARLQLEERYAALATWQSMNQFGRFVVTLLLIHLAAINLPHLLVGFAAIGIGMTAVSALSLDQVRRREIDLVGHRASAAAAPGVPLSAVLIGATPYCFCTIFYLIYSQGVIVIVERALGSEDAAIYNAAFIIVAAVYLAPGVIYMKYLVSKIFRWSAHDEEMFAATIRLGVAGGMVIGLLLMLLVMAAGSFVIPLLFGTRYAAAIPILQLLSLAIPVRFVQHAYGAAFFSEANMKRKVWYLGAAALICLVFSGVLIPIFGIKGAAMASVASEVTLLALFIRGVARYVPAIDPRSALSIPDARAALARVSQREAW